MNIQLQWLNPDNNHELLWDYSMCADTSRGAAIRDLIARALKGPLAPAQQEVHCYILIFLQDNDDYFLSNCLFYDQDFFSSCFLIIILQSHCWINLWHLGFITLFFSDNLWYVRGSNGTCLICSQFLAASHSRIDKGS